MSTDGMDWLRNANQGQGTWQPGGTVNGQPAVTRERTDGKADALYGGPNPRGDGKPHNHVVISKDGINATTLRENGQIVVNGEHPSDAYNGSPKVDPSLK